MCIYIVLCYAILPFPLALANTTLELRQAFGGAFTLVCINAWRHACHKAASEPLDAGSAKYAIDWSTLLVYLNGNEKKATTTTCFVFMFVNKTKLYNYVYLGQTFEKLI